MFTLGAWYESIDQAAAYANLAAVADPHLNIIGDIIHVPELNKLVGIAAMIENTVANRARLISPSLRRIGNFMVAPLNCQGAAAVEPDSPQSVIDLRENPLELVKGENLTFEALANPGAAQIQSAVAFFADGPISPVKGKIFTIRATSATAAVAGAWTNVAIVLDENLARGRYQIVGMQAISAGMLAARFVFVGQAWRPGVLGCDLISDQIHPMFRMGGMGVFGEFEDTDPPTIDVLAVSADATQEFYIDLIQVREGN